MNITSHSLKSSTNKDVRLQHSCDSSCDSVDGKVTMVEALMAKYDESQFQTDLTFFGARTSSKLQERAGKYLYQCSDCFANLLSWYYYFV